MRRFSPAAASVLICRWASATVLSHPCWTKQSTTTSALSQMRKRWKRRASWQSAKGCLSAFPAAPMWQPPSGWRASSGAAKQWSPCCLIRQSAIFQRRFSKMNRRKSSAVSRRLPFCELFLAWLSAVWYNKAIILEIQRTML